MNKEWPRKGEFVNLVLAWGLGFGYVNINGLKFDGVAGENFDEVVSRVNEDTEANDLITMALQLEVPVEDLEADGTFGPKWREVVALCKQEEEVATS